MNHDSLFEMLVTVVTAIFAGVMLVVIARRYRIPAIVLLLLGGITLGPQGLMVFDPASLGDGLTVLVSLAIGLILFEGGLTLDLQGYRVASGVIKRLLTIGVLVTWLVTALAIWLIVDGVTLPYAILSGSLVIVTGPTVIAPLLKRIKVVPRLHNILHWEGVLIDPIGVFVVILCLEWVIESSGTAAVANFALRVLSGMSIGLAGGAITAWVARRDWVPEEMINVFALACAVLIFGVTEAFASEAGLLSVTVAGLVIGISKPKQLKQIRQFKAEITDLLIGMLFILLAARLDFQQFLAFGLPGAVVVIVILLVVRPLSVFLCTWGSDLSTRERLFLGWVAPRGIVAASLASLVQIQIQGHDPDSLIAENKFIEAFTYSVIMATIIIQGSTVGVLTKALGLKRPAPTGWLVIGSHALGRAVARFLNAETGRKVLLVDSNARAVHEAHNEGLEAIEADARAPELADRAEMEGIGHVLALTDNEDFNQLVCQRWRQFMPSDRLYHWKSRADNQIDEADAAGAVVWQQLPKPSLISIELSNGESTLSRVSPPDQVIDNAATPLLAISEKVDVVIPSTDIAREELNTFQAVLCLRRRAEYLLRSLRDKLVLRSEASDLQGLFELLIDQVLLAVPSIPRDETVQELLERESTFPTALGHGVAVPHSYCHALNRRLCVIAQTPKGVDFKAADGEPVRLVFLVLSPPGDPEGHLATLAEIAKLVIDPNTRDQLIHATSPLELLRIVSRSKSK